jgi:hypothetical protein
MGSQNYIIKLTNLHYRAQKIILPHPQNYISGLIITLAGSQNFNTRLKLLHHRATKLNYRVHKTTLPTSQNYFPGSQNNITKLTKFH